MSDDRIKELYKKYAQRSTRWETMYQEEFAAALREALAEEMALAVRLLGHKLKCNQGKEICWYCAEAARFVAEHGKKED